MNERFKTTGCAPIYIVSYFTVTPSFRLGAIDFSPVSSAISVLKMIGCAGPFFFVSKGGAFADCDVLTSRASKDAHLLT